MLMHTVLHNFAQQVVANIQMHVCVCTHVFFYWNAVHMCQVQTSGLRNQRGTRKIWRILLFIKFRNSLFICLFFFFLLLLFFKFIQLMLLSHFSWTYALFQGANTNMHTYVWVCVTWAHIGDYTGLFARGDKRQCEV